MYCELGGDVCGEIGHLGHEKEAVCIVIICMWGDRALGTREGGCMYCELGLCIWGDRALGTREGGCMYCELGGDVCGEIGRLGHEKEVVCIVSWERMYVERSGT